MAGFRHFGKAIKQWGGLVPSLLNHMDFQKVKANPLHKVILGKPRLPMLFKFLHRSIQPNRLALVKFIANFLQCPENLMCPCILAFIRNDSIFDEPVAFPYLKPNTHTIEFLSFLVSKQPYMEKTRSPAEAELWSKREWAKLSCICGNATCRV